MHTTIRFLLAVSMPALTAAALAADAPPPSPPAVPEIRARQIAFAPDDAKRVIVATPRRDPLGWTVTDATGATVLRGTARVFGPDAASGDTVQQFALPELMQPGAYLLHVGDAAARSIAVAPHPLASLKYAALNYFYQTRAGIPILARYAGGTEWARAAGHPHEITTCFSGTDDNGTKWPGCDYSLDVTGGWYDAGDQGKYVVNGGISLWTLLDLYEQQRAWGDDSFADGKAKLPEAGNGTNDLLDEARWEMDFLLAMQIPAGKTAMVPVGNQPSRGKLRLTQIDASGMAHQKVADRNWTAIPTAPAADPETRLLYPPTTAATLNLAATAAQAARIWRTIDPAYAKRCLDAATRAYAAALHNPAVYATSSFSGSGGYGDDNVADEFYWATAELAITTGRAVFVDALRAMPAFRAPLDEPGWSNVAALGTISLATQPGPLPAADRAALRATIVAAADRYRAEVDRSGYHVPQVSAAFVWGSNGALLDRAIVLGLAERITGNRAYRDAATDVVGYLLGRNPLDQSFVSGFGTRPLMNPHHRFWAHQIDARYPGPPPGVVSGGPNSTAMTDTVSSTMKGKCVGMRCWRDAPEAFTMNEVAINWNAPLVWVATYLDATER